MISATFIEKPTSYSYFQLNNGMADIFIRIFDHEEIDGEGNTNYICKCNEFRADQKNITEEMVAKEPEKYLEYKVPEPVSIQERLEAVEATVLELVGVEYE